MISSVQYIPLELDSSESKSSEKETLLEENVFFEDALKKIEELGKQTSKNKQLERKVSKNENCGPLFSLATYHTESSPHIKPTKKTDKRFKNIEIRTQDVTFL